MSRRLVLQGSEFVSYTRSGSETVAVSIWDLRYRGKILTILRSVAPVLPVARRRLEALFASIWSGALRRRSIPPSVPLAAAQDASSPRRGQPRAGAEPDARRRPGPWTCPRLVSQSAALCLSPPKSPRRGTQLQHTSHRETYLNPSHPLQIQ
jgi:hypothetical protein